METRCDVGPSELKKRCSECNQVLDSSSFPGSSKESDGLARMCYACVNKRRRARYAANRSTTGQEKPSRLTELVKKGDYAAIKANKTLINAGNRERLLALAVMDFKSAPKKPSHVDLVKFLIQMGAKPDFHLVCAATVGPHVDIMNALTVKGITTLRLSAWNRGSTSMVPWETVRCCTRSHTKAISLEQGGWWNTVRRSTSETKGITRRCIKPARGILR
jgi:hypothetical protein